MEAPAGPHDLRERFGRQILLPEIGEEGQRRLCAARVLVVGLGGLGSPLALYLAASGVGTLGLVDSDAVESSNLHRQILFGASDVGSPKLDAAAQRLRAAYPDLRLELYPMRIGAADASEIVWRYDVVADGSDNFPTRFAISDACALTGRPYVYGSVLRFEGQVSVFDPPRGPCYRCLFREPPPPGAVPSCAEAGVLGVLPGIVGSLQALEVVKLLAGCGEPLRGRLLLLEGLELRLREVRIAPDPACPLCGENPSIREPVHYDSLGCTEELEMWGWIGRPVSLVSVEELQARLEAGEDIQILDVREPWEAERASIPGARLVPLGELKQREGELDRRAHYVVHCHVDGRARKAARMLAQAGFERVEVLEGGIVAWQQEKARRSRF